MSRPVPVPPPPGEPAAWDLTIDRRSRALEAAADLAMLAPSVHNTQPWRLELRADRLLLRADRTRRLAALDPAGRELVLSLGACLLTARVALAAAGWAVAVDRLPDPADPDLVAVLRPVPGEPDAELAALAPAVRHRRTNRRAFLGERVPAELLRRLTRLARADGATLVVVASDAQRHLVARLTQQADRLQNAEPAYRAELRHWTTRPRSAGDGVPPAVVPHVDGREDDPLPLRDFDTLGAGALPARTRSGTEQTLVLLATATDDAHAWLGAGEALQHLLLDVTAAGWVASPITQAIEVPLTRTQLRSALAWDGHPQMLLRIGRAGATPPTPRRARSDVVSNSRRPADDATVPARPTTAEPTQPLPQVFRRPVPDGRGGTRWI